MRCFIAAALAVVGLAIAPAHAAPPTSCDQISKLALADVTHIESTPVVTGEFSPPGAEKPIDGGALPAFCRVQLTVRPHIDIEVWLPEANWNQRFHGRGVGGGGGVIVYHDLAEALRQGYATATTDTGHKASNKQWPMRPDGSVDKKALDDYGWRSQHEMALKAKAVIQAYYGAGPRYSYFSGCSGGGRQALTEAQRFPKDYDGIMAGCAPNAFNRELATFLWPQVVMHQRLGQPISSDKLHALANAVMIACDANDGVADKLINDPRKCEFDPARLSCEQDHASPTCLTNAEVGAIRAIWNGPRSRDGKRLWFTPEKTVYTSMWESAPYPIGLAHLKWVLGEADADWTKLTEENFQDYMDRAIKALGPQLDADNPDLKPFFKRGGKLLMWHGDADWGDPTRDSINYYYRAKQANREIPNLDEAIRLFLLPGVGHCGGDWVTRKTSEAPFPSTGAADGNPGGYPDLLFNALVAWVEKGVIPERFTASQKLPDGTIRTRPVCAFPLAAKWTGNDNSDDAANYTCVNSEPNPADFKTIYD